MDSRKLTVISPFQSQRTRFSEQHTKNYKYPTTIHNTDSHPFFSSSYLSSLFSWLYVSTLMLRQGPKSTNITLRFFWDGNGIKSLKAIPHSSVHLLQFLLGLLSWMSQEHLLQYTLLVCVWSTLYSSSWGTQWGGPWPCMFMRVE